MNFVIAVIGSGGDLYPLMAIAKTLKQQGHQITLLAGEWQKETVESAGLNFQQILTTKQFKQFTDNAGKEANAQARWMNFFYDLVIPAIKPVFDYVATHYVTKHGVDNNTLADTCLLGSSHVIGFRLLQEKYAFKLLTTRLQPEPVQTEQTRAGQVYFERLLTPAINRQRQDLGLGKLAEPFYQWLVHIDNGVAFFPSWFIHPATDAPEQGKMLDFLIFDPVEDTQSSPQLDIFLAKYELPVVFTHGTGNNNSETFFHNAVQTCKMLNQPALLLCQSTQPIPADLPSYILHVNYLPFEQLLPYAGCMIHHGGIGTCAQVLRAGIPQIIVPVGFDQFQTADRVEQLGVGLRMDLETFSPEQGAHKLRKLMESGQVLSRCRQLKAHFNSEHTIDWICTQMVESIK